MAPPRRKAAAPPPTVDAVRATVARTAHSSDPRTPTERAEQDDARIKAELPRVAALVDAVLARVKLEAPVTRDDCEAVRVAVRAALPPESCSVEVLWVGLPAHVDVVVWVGFPPGTCHRDRKIERRIAL